MLAMTHLGKYLIRRELGKGSMGVVYEGFDPVLQRRVAIKTILPAQLVRGEAADVLARFKREAQAAGRLNHPGIVGVYDYGEVLAADDRSEADPDATQSIAGQRVAFIAMATFLELNGNILTCDQAEGAAVILEVAASQRSREQLLEWVIAHCSPKSDTPSPPLPATQQQDDQPG